MIGESSVFDDHSANLGGSPAPNSVQIFTPINLQTDGGNINFRVVTHIIWFCRKVCVFTETGYPESNQKLGVLRGLFGFGGASESWVPSPEGCLKVMVERVGPHLQKQMRTAMCPSHLLLLDEALGE